MLYSNWPEKWLSSPRAGNNIQAAFLKRWDKYDPFG
jgi:hypothetical protein